MTIGQYLQPTKQHMDVKKYYTPEQFALLKEEGMKRGFSHVESGPLVRSSYHAHEQVRSAEAAVKA
jgi:lipoic acid synthetase